MKVITDLSGQNPDDPDHYMRFDAYGDDSNENILFAHWGSIINTNYRKKYADYKRKVSWSAETPCSLLTGHEKDKIYGADLEDYFDKVYTVCPYTAKWLNENIHHKNKFELAVIGYNEDEIPKKDYIKEFDAIYWGGVHAQDHMAILDAIRSFKSNFFTINPLLWSARSLMDQSTFNKYTNQLTGIGVAHKVLWETLAKTKIFISTNMLFLQEKHVNSIKTFPTWEKNEAFSRLEQLIVPQMKTRPIAAAFNKSLNLIKRDPWNVIENWFQPDVDFIYFDNYEELPTLITNICNNWGDYKGIVDNAFQKAVNSYTCRTLFKKMSGGGCK